MAIWVEWPFSRYKDQYRKKYGGGIGYNPTSISRKELSCSLEQYGVGTAWEGLTFNAK